MGTDTGISKTLLNSCDWNKIEECCRFVKTSKRFRPYGTAYHLLIKVKAKVTLQARNGAEIETWICAVNDRNDQSLLGKADAIRLGIVQLNLRGRNGSCQKNVIHSKRINFVDSVVFGGETQQGIDKRSQDIVKEFPTIFTYTIGRFRREPIKIQVKSNVVPAGSWIQVPRRIPLHYRERAKAELEKMVSEDIIEGPIDIEEPGTFLRNLVLQIRKVLIKFGLHWTARGDQVLVS